MTDRGYRFCEKHPKEPVAYCSFCLREVRIETRAECAELHRKMGQYRDSIVTPRPKKEEGDEWP